MKEIVIWSDYSCPFCYIAEKRLQDAITDLGLEKQVKITYKAFQLNRNAPAKTMETVAELLAKKYNLTPEEAKQKIEAIDKAGNESGLVFRYATAHPSNTLDAHRLMKYAQDKHSDKEVKKLNEGLFEAYFTDNRVLADHDVLMQVAINAGLPTEEVSRVLNSEDYIKQVRSEENEAHGMGVKGVPYLVFNGTLAVPGAVSVEEFKQILQKI